MFLTFMMATGIPLTITSKRVKNNPSKIKMEGFFNESI